MQNQSPMIPTIKQVHQQLLQSYNELDQLFKNIGIAPLSQTQDLQTQKRTINKVLSSIPTQQQLINKYDNATNTNVKQAISRYSGDNQLILKARQNFNQLKRQQQKIYFLAAQYQLTSVSPEFKQKKTQNVQNLNSYTDVTEVKKTKWKTLEKNCISEQYFQEGHAQIQGRIQAGNKNIKHQFLKPLDLLVHVNFYDSHNAQKQYQFVCVEEQNLGSLVNKFKCLIDSLSKVQTLRNKPEMQSQNYEIYDKFYKPQIDKAKTYNYGHHGRKNGHHEMNNNSTNSALKYLVIQDMIYYEGNKNDLQPLLKYAYNRIQKINYRCLQINKTKMCDLRVIFGKPYLYRHMGGCDHIIIFKTARLFKNNDQFNHDIVQVQKYPITVFQSKMKRRKCEACAENFSDIVAIGDPHKDGQNLYLCMGCHKDLHYDENGNHKFGEKINFVNYIHD